MTEAEQTTTRDPEKEIEAVAADLGLTMTAVFVPWSQSRNAGEKDPSLNWRVTFHRAGREVLTTDYYSGLAASPTYQKVGQREARKLMHHEAIVWECEHGYPASTLGSALATPWRKPGSKALMPKLTDVLACLTSDASVIDCGTFEEWARDLGYDTDSRKAEATYRACLDQALKLRAAIGDDGLNRLRNAARDY